MTMLKRLLSMIALLALAACGGSGGGSSKATKTPDPNGTPTPTNTRRPTRTPGPPMTLFVRKNGNDKNAGTTPAKALQTLTAAVKKLNPGSTLYVGPGTYQERLIVTGITGTADLPVQIVADRTGAHTGDAAGDVVIDADGNLVAAIITGSPYVTLDGFIIRGVVPTATASAVLLRVRGQSDNVTLRNCVVTNTEAADGIRIDSSSNVLAFNNLVYSADRGIIVTGAANDVALINNTVTLSQRAALSVRASGGNSPQGVVATNCLFQANGSGAAIDDGGTGGYSGDYNLVFQPDAEDQAGDYNPTSLRGANDVNADAQLVAPDVGDVHLQPNSPAIDAGTDAIDDALKSALVDSSTTANGAPDTLPPDIGYHYPP